MNTIQKQVMEELKEQVKGWGVSPEMTASDDMDILRAVLNGMGEERKGSLLLELAFLPTAEAEFPDDFSLFQIYATIETDLLEEKLPGILAKLNKINLESILGNYAVFPEGNQLYFRYVGVVRGKHKEAMMDIIQPALNWCVSTLDEDYDRLIALCRS